MMRSVLLRDAFAAELNDLAEVKRDFIASSSRKRTRALMSM
jgi:hypothetical protein